MSKLRPLNWLPWGSVTRPYPFPVTGYGDGRVAYLHSPHDWFALLYAVEVTTSDPIPFAPKILVEEGGRNSAFDVAGTKN